MSSLEVSAKDGIWSADLDGERAEGPSRSSARAARWLAAGYGLCLFVVDILIILGAFLLAHWLRFAAPEAEAASLGLEQYARMGLTVALLTAILFALHDFYDQERAHTWSSRLHIVTSSVSVALVGAVALSFFLGDQGYSRLWFAAAWALAAGGVMAWRTVAQALYRRLERSVVPARHLLVVGANPLGRQLAHELIGRYRVVGYVDNGSTLDGPSGFPFLGPISQLDELVQLYAVDELVIALPPARLEQVYNVIARGFRRPVRVKFLPDLGDLLPRTLELRHESGRPYIGFAPVAKVSVLKRAMDLLLGSILVLALAPVLALIALIVKLDSPGPIFYRQVRVGRDGRHFAMLKFRSMRQDAERLLTLLREHNEASGPLFKMRQDPRVTRVGRFLRRYSLDELPQLFNVLKGEMSLVGPRPPIPSEVERYEDWQIGRLRAVPGITGLWQVSGRSEVPFPDMVRLDLHYIRNWSLGLDLEILFRTVPAVLSKRGAY